jgi:hypothetical protein
MSQMAEKPFSRLELKRLAEFVDRTDEMKLYTDMLDEGERQIMVVYAEVGMGKTSLLLRMVHECALRKLRKAKMVCTDTGVDDYMAVLRTLRDDLGVEHFGAFTDLINYYTDPSYTPRLEINVNVQGSVHVAENAQISGSSVGDIAGVVVRDNTFTVQRPDIAVPDEVRRQELTQRFLEGLRELSGTGGCVVLFFDAVEKMSDPTYQWMWEQLLPPVRDELPNVRAVMCGQRRPPEERDWGSDFVATAELEPLGVDDIDLYIANRLAGKGGLTDEMRRMAAMAFLASTGGRPADVAMAVDRFVNQLPSAG